MEHGIIQIEDVYESVYETCGRYWPYIHHYIFIAIILMQITMIGLFGLKSKPAASIATIPLLLMTIAFNEYCKIRFLPTFCRFTIQVNWTASVLHFCAIILNFMPISSCSGVLQMYVTNCSDEENVFCHLPLFLFFYLSGVSDQDAGKHDELDQKNGQLEVNYEQASNAYRQPSLQPVNWTASDSSFTLPLVSPL